MMKMRTNMNSTEARQIFDTQIAAEVDADRITKLELLREYYCNPEFRKAMENEVSRINGL